MNLTKRKISILASIILVVIGIWWLSTPHSYADCVLHYVKPNMAPSPIIRACELKFGLPEEQEATSNLPHWLVYSSRPLTPIPSLLISYTGLLAYLRLAKGRKFKAHDPIGAALAYGATELVVYTLSVDDMHALAAIGLAVGLVTGLIWLRLTGASHPSAQALKTDAAQKNQKAEQPPLIVEQPIVTSKLGVPLMLPSLPIGASATKIVPADISRRSFWIWSILLCGAGAASVWPYPFEDPAANLGYAMGYAIAPLFLACIIAFIRRIFTRNGLRLTVLLSWGIVLVFAIIGNYSTGSSLMHDHQAQLPSPSSGAPSVTEPDTLPAAKTPPSLSDGSHEESARLVDDNQLNLIAKEINSKLPKIANDDVRFDGVTPDHKTLNYHYTLIHMTSRHTPEEYQFDNHALTEYYCKSQKRLVDGGVSVSWAFYAKDGTLIKVISAVPTQCK